MSNKETFQYDLVKKLSFVRYGGTEGELKAANIILKEIEKVGGKGEIMEFTIPSYNCTVCTAYANAPLNKDIKVVPYGNSGEIEEGGKEFKLVYIEGNEDDYFLGNTDLTDCAVLINALDFKMYKQLINRNAGAFIVISGKWYHDDTNSDLVERIMREEYQTVGHIPGFMMRSSDVMDIINNGVETITLQLRCTKTTATSRDVVAVIEGTEIKDESICITGHYDSILVGTGSWDNATGAAMVSMLYNHFLVNPPKRTLRFVWCGSEEQGLYGSINYIKQNMDIIDQIKFVFNFDMNGTTLGNNNAFITGGKDLETYYSQTMKEVGYHSTTRVTIHSSDSAPFALKGIPSLGLGRGTMTAAEIHTRYDLMETLSAKEMYKNFQFASYIIGKFTNSVVLPIERKIPDDLKKKAEEYFWLDRVPDFKVFGE